MNFPINFESVEFYKLVLEQLGTFAILDKDGYYLYVNELWAEKMKCTVDAAIGRHVLEFFPETRALEAMKHKIPIIAHPIQISKDTQEKQYTSYSPLYKDKVLIGCLIHTIFHDSAEALQFSDEFSKMLGERNYYKTELRKIQGAKYSIDNIIGNSRQIMNVKENIIMAARSVSNVLIEGETGCGKELIAHSVHDLSQRNSNPIIKVNCAAIPLELAESELFGYEYGAFTGAKSGGKIGKFELAKNGTLFLDEVNQLSPLIQPKLLRVLQEREIERVGGSKTVHFNARLITATNVPLEQLIEEKLFRADLYYRLNVINIRIPPLRERIEDIPLLIADIIHKLNRQLGTSVEGVNHEVVDQFQSYHWPGNVRELQNILERAMNEKISGILTWKHFTHYFHQKKQIKSETAQSVAENTYRDSKKQFEKSMILNALEQFNGNKKKTAEFIGISRTMLYKKLKEYHIT